MRWQPEAEGLSPRVRGNPADSLHAADTGRSIPACAGEPLIQQLNHLILRVYPRVCGGTTDLAVAAPSGLGLSPRVRGNPGGHNLGGGCRRSIPACAGEPFPPPSAAVPLPVYPRVCGGTRAGSLLAGNNCGLSPRVRGNRVSHVTGSRRLGSIPACAGEPAPFQVGTRRNAVYPRVCGGTQIKPR